MDPWTQDEVDEFMDEPITGVTVSFPMVVFIFVVQAVVVLGLFGAGVWVLLTLLRLFGVL